MAPRSSPPIDRVAEVLAKVVTKAHPELAAISEETRRKATEQFLEGLEQHGAGLMRAFLASVSDGSDIPAELAPMLEEMGMPTAQFTGIVQQFFVFGVMFTLASQLLAPFVQVVANDVWSAHPDRPLDPSIIATAVGRGLELGAEPTLTVPGWAHAEAAKTGVDADHINLMASLVGLPPALQELFELYRRGVIGIDRVRQGLQEGDFRDDWIDETVNLAHTWITPVDFVRAAVQAQLPFDTAKEWAGKTGLDTTTEVAPGTDMFTLLRNIAGRPPGIVELIRLANRGFVARDGLGPDVLSVQQAVAESDIKTKWTPVLEKLAQYFPPNGEVKTMVMHGAITAEQAIALWKANGVSDDLAKAYLYLAQTEQVTQDRAIAKGDILTLVQEQAISDDVAKELLGKVGYFGDNADELIAMAHYRYELEALRSAVRRVAQLYTTRKITAAEASSGFASIGLPPEQIRTLLDTLTAQRDAQVIEPTPAMIMTAARYAIITNDEALTLLEQLGYSKWSAWLALSAHLHGPAGPEPPRPSSLS